MPREMEQRLAGILARIEVKFPGLTMRQDGACGVCVVIETPERDTGKPTKFHTFEDLFYELHDDDDARIIRRLRRKLRDVLEHELDEHFYLDGVRVFDPHPQNGDYVIVGNRGGRVLAISDEGPDAVFTIELARGAEWRNAETVRLKRGEFQLANT